jgi:peptidoglycan hydrolase CwlO-like protein
MSSEIIMALVTLFCTTVGSFVTFILTKRKYNVEVDSQQIKNMEDAFDTYKKMTDETIKAQNSRIEMLQRENENLRNQFNQLQSQMLTLLVGKKLGITEEIVQQP